MQTAKRWIGLIAILVMALTAPLAVQAARADDGAFEWKGIIESRPTGGTIGTWVIDGMTFEATAATHIEEEYHALTVGTCAKVEYNVVTGSNVAVKIEDEGMSSCSETGDDGDHVKLYARLDAAPPADIYNGTWEIGGQTYTSTASTSFDFSHGAPVAGSCVEIEYNLATPTVLHSLETEADYKCDGSGGGSPPGQPHAQVYGVVDAFPAALVGTWTIDGVDYVADAATRFEQERGSFFVGGCVDVKYQVVNGVNQALEIEVSDANRCGGSGGSQVEEKLYGLLSAVPANYTTTVATWTIGGADFVSDPATTKFEQEKVAFAAGVCIEVEYYTSSGVKNATKIETKEAYKCNTNSYTNEIYGTIVTMPAGLYGSWVISATNGITDTYNAGDYTRFKQEDRPFAVGQCVKVKYFVENGVNKATKIETESENDHCSGSGTPTLPASSKVYALLDSFPGGTLGSLNLGTWVIGGESYLSNAATRYETEHGAFAPNICVEAKYYVDTNGDKILLKVETENPEKCQQSGSSTSEFKAYGAVEGMPTPFSAPGTWTISGIDYETSATTKFEQSYGAFAVGAYVEVKYVISGTVNTTLSIETHVPPSGGRTSVTGVLTGQPDIDGDGWTDWQVDGQDYFSDPAIDIDPALSGGTPRVAGGQKVALNTYLGLDGKTYVTYATTLKQIYLPLIMR